MHWEAHALQHERPLQLEACAPQTEEPMLATARENYAATKTSTAEKQTDKLEYVCIVLNTSVTR